jgi:hypothetical protein
MKSTHIKNATLNAGAFISSRERGSATIIALLVLGLMMIFVTVALTRSTGEAMAMRNEAETGRAFYAAQGSLETMTRNFNKVYENKLNPTNADLDNIETKPVLGFDDYNFTQMIEPTSTPKTVVIAGGDYAGLNSLRQSWRLTTTATSKTSGAQVQMTRNFYNNLIPVFQFGIFYDGDLTLHNGPAFAFGGRVHTNSNFYLTPSGEARFDSRVSASGEIVTQLQRNGFSYTHWSDNARIKNASGNFVRLYNNMGSVLGGPDLKNSDPDVANGSPNPQWPAYKATFDGNLLDRVNPMRLPISKVVDSEKLGYARLLKRGRQKPTGDSVAEAGDLFSATAVVNDATKDNQIVANERFSGKPNLRISLGDFKNRLPGCVKPNGDAISAPCGVRLDSVPDAGNANYDQIENTYESDNTDNLGYQPLAMIGAPAYSTTKFNAYRMYRGKDSDHNSGNNRRQVWIKVEIVDTDPTTGMPEAVDVTRDFLSLGFTETPPRVTGKHAVGFQNDFKLAALANSANQATIDTELANTPVSFYGDANNEARDNRAIIKMQRWGIPGPPINGQTSATTAMPTPTASPTPTPAPNGFYKHVAANNTESVPNAVGWNVVTEHNEMASPKELAAFSQAPNNIYAMLTVNGVSYNKKIVPFPVEMFDPREGIYNEDLDTATAYGNNSVPLNGVMGLIDVDVINLRRFLNGEFDNKFPAAGTPFSDANGRGLKASDVPVNDGWILSLSDRRGDWNFDGDYAMEDVFGPNDGVLQINEDINSNNILDVGGRDPHTNSPRKYVWEGTRYLTGTVSGLGTWGNADTYKKMLYPDDPSGADRYATARKDIAAFADHRYYRRGFRMINAETLPGQTDLSNPNNTRGFTVAAEQAIYLYGNYNATGVVSVGTPTPPTNYLPQATVLSGPTVGHVPAAVAADQVAFLSNAWLDGKTWRNPFASAGRPAADTTYRAALMFGIPRARLDSTEPDQGGGDPGLDGGVHNFINMRENWSGKRLNYCGSMVSIFNARNNTGAFKCCGKVYDPPTRNWVFDASFLDSKRIPPGTPKFQYLQITGFQRTNE